MLRRALGLVQWRGLMVWSIVPESCSQPMLGLALGSRPVAWLDGMVEILVSVEFTTGKGRERVRVLGTLEFTTLDDEVSQACRSPVQALSTKLPETYPQFPPWEWTLANKGLGLWPIRVSISGMA